jgi:hypothetical protein
MAYTLNGEQRVNAGPIVVDAAHAREPQNDFVSQGRTATGVCKSVGVNYDATTVASSAFVTAERQDTVRPSVARLASAHSHVPGTRP